MKPVKYFIGFILALIMVEAAFRTYLYTKGSFSSSFRVSSVAFGKYDESFGITYPPNKTFSFAKITNDQVTWCPAHVSRSNKDGLNGKTTLEEYNNAQIKILVFGDSFTHWNQNSYTWPDLFQEELEKKVSKKTAVLNYARGTYGLIQMVDLASRKIKEHKPDLVIFAFITNDLDRARWWTNTLSVEGFQRPLLSPYKDNFDLSVSSDEYLVNPKATLEWCVKSLGQKEPDDTLKEVIHQYKLLKQSIKSSRNQPMDTLFSLKQSYFINLLRYKHPFKRVYEKTIPQLKIQSFSQDKKFLENLAEIKGSNIPYFFIHLPLKKEMVHQRIHANEQQRNLLSSLILLNPQNVYFLHEVLADKDDVPGVIDLYPHDPHPNFSGLQLYAHMITDLIVRKFDFNK